MRWKNDNYITNYDNNATDRIKVSYSIPSTILSFVLYDIVLYPLMKKGKILIKHWLLNLFFCLDYKKKIF